MQKVLLLIGVAVAVSLKQTCKNADSLAKSAKSFSNESATHAGRSNDDFVGNTTSEIADWKEPVSQSEPTIAEVALDNLSNEGVKSLFAEDSKDVNQTTISADSYKNDLLSREFETLYWDDGAKKAEIPYVTNQKHGTEIWYHKNGRKGREPPFFNGKEHGTEIRYYEDGTKEWKVPFVDGKINGTVIKYRPDGTKEAEIVYENGEEISDKRF